MAIFGKKKKKEEDLEQESKKSEPKFRKKRKKDPPKSWGRKERLLVFLILFLTVSASVVLGLYSRGWKLPGLPRLKMPSVTIPFIGEETIIIEGNKEEAEKAKIVKSGFIELTNDYSGIYGLYVVRLGNGSRYGVNENDILQAASLIKLPVMVALYKEEEEGRLDLEEKYVLKKVDRVAGAGTLYGKPVGYEVTYKELLRLMGKQSDNTAFNIVKNLLGEERVSEVIQSIGMLNTSLIENTTTPVDIGVLFEGIYSGNLLNDENKNELLGFLTDTVFESWIVDGVPEGIQVAHKFGRERNVVNDAGIVMGDNPYVIVVMGDRIVEKEADELLPKISRMVYEIETTSGN
jgi:beta-lactamase class A